MHSLHLSDLLPPDRRPTGPGARPRLTDFLGAERALLTARTDRAFALLLALQWAAAVGVAVWVSPYSWKGQAPVVHDHVWAAAGLGGVAVLPPLALIALRPGWWATRQAVAVGQMLTSALLIHLTGGRIETHFHIFGSLAFLAVYRDWTVLLTATGVIAADHALRGVFAPESVFGGAEPAPLARALEHAGWVLFADFFLIVTFAWSDRAIRAAAERGVRELGQYRLVRLLSSGGMGDVYLAEHRMLKRPCAVKVIRGRWAGDPAVVTRFEREVQATARLRHPNTVQVYDYGVGADGTFFYAMEYLDGRSLAALVRTEGRMPPDRVVHLLRQVAGALREAHAAGLVHRDVNPNNILVCDLGGLRDVAKLLDFGLVRPVDAGPDDAKLTHHGTFVGTPEYVSPEQARGKEVDARSDLYTLGAVGYFLLTGRPPFERADKMDVLFAHCHDAPAPPTQVCPDVPADLEAVVLRCLAKNPADRYPDADALDRALAACGRRRLSDWFLSPDSRPAPGQDTATGPGVTMVVNTRPDRAAGGPEGT